LVIDLHIRKINLELSEGIATLYETAKAAGFVKISSF